MNRITVEGRVAGEPRTGTTAKGIAYTSFSLADYQGKEYGVQATVFVEWLTNWNEEVNRFSDDSKSTAADDVDIPF